MPTNAVFPDGVPKGVLEAEDFDKDVNPLTLLSHLEEVLSAHLPTLEDSSLITLSEGPLRQELQLDISKTDTSLKSSAKYVMTFMDTLTALAQTLGNVRQKLTDKLNKEFVNFIPGERQMTEEEVRILQQQTQIHKDFADRAAELAALEKLADQIHEATVLLGQEVVRVREEAEQAKAALEEAERQAELRRKEDREKREREEAERRAREEQKMREEEERRRIEEERNKHPEVADKQREEERRQRELEEQARNPANWSPFIYTVSGEEDVTGTGLGCVLRVPPGNIEQTDVKISVVDQLNSTFRLGDNEELVSNLINIEVNEGAIYEFPHPPWVALSNCSHRGQSAREVVIRICTDGQTWAELPTKDAKLPDSPELRLVEGPFRTLCNMTVCAVSKLRIDKEKVSNWGTKVVSSVDSRVSLVIPKGSVRFSSEVSLQVQPVDSTTISHVKAHVESMGGLVASSHIVNIQAQGKFQKAATMWMPSPGSSRRPKTSVTPLGQKKASASQRPSTASSRSKEDKETVVLVWKKGQGDWQHANGETLTETRDLVSFNLNITQIPTSIFLLRIKQVDSQPPLDVAAAARYVEQAVKGKCVNVALRQRSDDMSSIYIEVCKSDKTEKLLHNLTTRGLDSGPQPSDDFLLSEGQVVEVRFRGNITNDDEQVIRFPYNSNLESARCQLFVKEVDKFAQHGLDCYRGHAQVLTVAPTPPNTNKAAKTENNETSNETTCPDPPPMKLLTELPITLPKAPMKPPTLNRINVQIEEQGPLTKEYFEALSADLGDEWRQLAEFLGVKPARVESIKREYLESDNKEKVVQDVLMNWYKQTSRNGDKVGELFWALKDTGRVDLSDELLDKNDAFQKRTEMRKENDKMQKAFKFVTESAMALREWKFLARELRLSEADIEELSHKESNSLREQCYQMLHYWRESSGQKATRKNLARALKACKFLEPAEKIKQIR